MTLCPSKNKISKTLLDRLVQHEGLRLKPYRCTKGKLTIGVGRNLEDKGLSKEEAFFLLQNDILEVQNECEKQFKFFNQLSPTRQEVLLEMAFNLGIKGLKGFKKFLKALDEKDYLTASKEMLNSKWAFEVKGRAKRLALLMKTDPSLNESDT